jgi:hypothetical protein
MLLVLALAARPTLACRFDTSLHLRAHLPDRAPAPRDSRVWLHFSGHGTPVVTVTSESRAVTGSLDQLFRSGVTAGYEELWMFTPDALLPANATVEVKFVDARKGEVSFTFQTNAEVGSRGPTTPALTLESATTTEGEDSCREKGRREVRGTAVPTGTAEETWSLLFDVKGTPVAVATSPGPAVWRPSQQEGDACYAVALIGAPGMSVPSALQCTSLDGAPVPPTPRTRLGPCGCASGASSGLAAGAASLLVLARRRRRFADP